MVTRTQRNGTREGNSSAMKGGESMKTGEVWSAKSFENVVVCPVPGCHHQGGIITKVHCRTVHGMEREEIEKLYGLPQEKRLTKTKKLAKDCSL